MTLTASDIKRLDRIWGEAKRGIRIYGDDAIWVCEMLIQYIKNEEDLKE
tara:strand:- start:2106 stop:2252 length:147 start_codon:yes stop_codon:yes gene_type:complete